jgi:hypothetical protein
MVAVGSALVSTGEYKIDPFQIDPFQVPNVAHQDKLVTDGIENGRVPVRLWRPAVQSSVGAR